VPLLSEEHRFGVLGQASYRPEDDPHCELLRVIMMNGPIEKNRPTLVAWALRTQDILRVASSLQKPFFECPHKLPHPLEWLVSQLGVRCTLTSDSVLLLVGQLKFWDAEILARVCLEGTFKLAYICSGTDEERHRKTEEFLDEMPAIARLRRHSRVERLLTLLPNPNDASWRALRDLLLTNGEKEELWQQYPKARRAALERKWSLPGLAEELAQTEAFHAAAGLLHTYGMSSSLAHVDGDAVLTMSEREGRSPERVAAIELAHGARLLSDMISYATLRSYVVLKAKKLDPGPVRDRERDTATLCEELCRATEDWARVEYGE